MHTVAQPGRGPVFSTHADKMNVSPHRLWFQLLSLLLAADLGRHAIACNCPLLVPLLLVLVL